MAHARRALCWLAAVAAVALGCSPSVQAPAASLCETGFLTYSKDKTPEAGGGAGPRPSPRSRVHQRSARAATKTTRAPSKRRGLRSGIDVEPHDLHQEGPAVRDLEDGLLSGLSGAMPGAGLDSDEDGGITALGVLERGRVSQCGPHADLVRQNGAYRRLWNLQSGFERELEDDLQGREATLPEASLNGASLEPVLRVTIGHRRASLASSEADTLAP